MPNFKLNFIKLNFNSTASKSIVVVEIGNDWLKVIENTAGQISKVRVLKLVDIKGPVSEAIAKIFKDLKIKKSGVIVSIPRHLATVRILELPSTDPDEIKDMVELQVGKQTPYSKEEIISSHSIVSEGREGYKKVMLIIARRNLVGERIDVLQKAGIDVDKVILSSEGVFHWFNHAYKSEIKKEETVVVVDIDSNYSDFLVIREGKLVYTRNILIGANHLIGEIGKWEEKFIDEIGHSLELFHTEERFVNTYKMYLGGIANNLKGLDKFLATRLNMPVETTNPVLNMKDKNDVVALYNKDYKFTSLCPLFGMVLNNKLELDLTPSGLRIQKVMEEQRKQITIMGVLFLSICMVISIYFLQYIYNKNSYLTELKEKVVKIEQDSQQVDKMRLSIDLIKQRLDAKKRSIAIFLEIQKLTPKEIYFTNINIDEGRETVLQGRADKMSNVFAFVTTLESSPYFENVKTTYTTTKKERDAEYARFEIICSAEKPENF